MSSRREFITLLGGVAAGPVAARAQQPEGGRRIGVLMNLAERDPEGQARIGALREGLAKLGRTEGREWQKPLSKLPSPGRLFPWAAYFSPHPWVHLRDTFRLVRKRPDPPMCQRRAGLLLCCLQALVLAEGFLGGTDETGGFIVAC
jgi:hypothetical protein